MRTADAVVIGGGLHGCATALHLALRGLRPLLLERGTVGRHASGANAGGVRSTNRHVAELPLAAAALDRWRRLPDLLGEDVEFHAGGHLLLAENDRELAVIKARAAQTAALGYTFERVVRGNELHSLAPALSPGIGAALYSETDGSANPMRTVSAYRRRGEAAGVRVQEGAAVAGLSHDGQAWTVRTGQEAISTRLVVNCAGAWGGAIAAETGDVVPLKQEAPMMMVTARTAHFLGPVVQTIGRKLTLKQVANGTVLVGGGHRAVIAGENTELDFDELRISAGTVTSLFPHLAAVPLVRAWAGIEGFMPDRIPVIGPSTRYPGLLHAFGFSGHGFQLGPIVGELLAELAVTGASPLPITPFRIDRFQPGRGAIPPRA